MDQSTTAATISSSSLSTCCNALTHQHHHHHHHQGADASLLGSDMECIEENVIHILERLKLNQIIDEITEAEPTSVTLRYCKRKFLRPYVIILALAGIRPSSTDLEFLGRWVGHLQTALVLCLLCLGYVLQFLCGFRQSRLDSLTEGRVALPNLLASIGMMLVIVSRDHGFPTTNDITPAAATTGVSVKSWFTFTSRAHEASNGAESTTWNPLVAASNDSEVSPNRTHLIETEHTGFAGSGEAIFIYLIPALLHLNGYLLAVFIYRFADNEQLQCLVERVFILSNNPRRLVRTLWLYFGLGVGWLGASIAYVLLLGGDSASAYDRFTSFRWPLHFNASPTAPDLLRAILTVTLFCHDLVQMVVIVSYSLICYLLRCYLKALKEKLLLHTIEPLNWMREICEFRKLLYHLNTRISLPVASLTVLNLSYTVASVVHLFRDMTACPINIFTASLANILLWLFISLMPFFQAASLTVTCRQTQSCGHLISIRPFVHRNTSSEDLNTVLLYASSLKMSAKLFRMPISAHYLCFFVLVCFIAILTFGMCLNISLGTH
ncbi:hypothetical protein AND_005875 [Anopheles darlingi]|uniref:Odorant receptor n=1 Tax=Anopheles darlingi TaxID=43151 RepID=W5JGI5_ANODA|nr:hypothetical protein AND_005875 [Anopheles darlingi]